jgi:hypothetical protein
MKVVINRCWGGFGLSDEAIEVFLNRKSIPWEKTPCKYEIGSSDYWVKGFCEDPEHYLDPYELTEDRSDPDLVAVVEELSHRANGYAAELEVIEIPDDVDWEIISYDGAEHVAEKHRIWR